MGLEEISGEFAIHRLPPGARLPDGLLDQPLYSVLGSGKETSILCPIDFPVDAQASEAPYSCVRVVGQLDFALTGILADLTRSLAEAGVPVFAVSSYDTDYLFYPSTKRHEALTALGVPLE
jgi:hypothetical protein